MEEVMAEMAGSVGGGGGPGAHSYRRGSVFKGFDEHQG